MEALALLRTLAEFQQYPELQQTAQQCWDDSQAPAILPLLAIAYANLGNMTQAKAYCEQAQVHKASLDGDSLCDLAAVFIVMQQLEQAALLLSQILAAEPEHALALARLAYCKLAANETAEAQALFEQSLSINDQRVTVYTNLIALYMDQKNVELAQQQLEKAFITLEARQHEYPEGLYQQYWVQLNSIQLQLWVSGENSSEQNAQAEDWLHNLYEQQQAGECDETLFIHCLKHYSRLLAERDEHQQASDILREYVKQYPANSELCLALSELEKVQGHFIQAINLLQKAIKHDNENIGLWVQLSSACLHRFDKKARDAAEKAMEM
jgi:tetratricopeptide (TPR) repeat protein